MALRFWFVLANVFSPRKWILVDWIFIRFFFQGLHLEGPYINKARKGAHRLEFVQHTLPNGAVDFDMTYGDLEHVSIVTVAPELEGGMAAIEQLSKRGVVVSLGTNFTLFFPE